ncbi:hypothetical protein ACP3T3_06135 [Chryseobacterium sp. CBSDS_008]|uniref:hypothetical protein n=1 Tax=Chryseobacterium sp. CBSDS_008 TaxID=3415265 RepID=UPI003CE6B338
MKFSIGSYQQKTVSHLNVEDSDPVWEKFAEVEFSKKIFTDNKAYLVEDGLCCKYINRTSDIDAKSLQNFISPMIFSVKKGALMSFNKGNCHFEYRLKICEPSHKYSKESHVLLIRFFLRRNSEN